MRPYDSVVLTQDVSDLLRVGMEGAIVEHLADGVYMVECFDPQGKTVDVDVVRAEQMMVTVADFFDGEQIALLQDIPGHALHRGQVGTIQTRVGVGVYRVVFFDAERVPYAELNLHAAQMMLLHWQPVQQSA